MLFATPILFLHADGLVFQKNTKKPDIFQMSVGPVKPLQDTGDLILPKNGQFLHESRIGSIPIFSFDTLVQDEEMSAWGAGMGDNITNIGAGLHWGGIKSKTCAIRDQAKQLMSKGISTPVVFIDGGDVLYGGCGESELSSRYKMTVANCGGSELIFGAELGLYPDPEKFTEGYEKFSGRWESVMHEANLSEHSYAKYVKCIDGIAGPCSQPPRIQFLNGGFVMGPPNMIHTAYDFACAKLQETNGNSEQRYLHQFLLSNGDTTCLDYSSSLVLNLHQFDPKAAKQLFGVEEGKLWNNVASKYQCFVHGNGNGKGLVKDVAQHLMSQLAN